MFWVILSYPTELIICDSILVFFNKNNFLYIFTWREAGGQHNFIWCILCVFFIVHNKLTKGKERFFQSLSLKYSNDNVLYGKIDTLLRHLGLLGPSIIYIGIFLSSHLLLLSALIFTLLLSLCPTIPEART